MLRTAAVVGIVICLSPVSLFAQAPVFTVTEQAATVYKSPSTGSPVIGRVGRGAELPVSRELGSWVKVSWPTAADGFGYVHVTMGRLTSGDAPRSAAASSARRSGSSAVPARGSQAEPRSQSASAQPIVARPPAYITPASHAVGLGARGGSSNVGLGVSARAWRRNRFGLQLAMTRDSMTNAITAEHMTSSQFEPSVIYALRDKVTDYVWLRPYVGSGVQFWHQSMSVPGFTDSVAKNTIGFQAFGGAEMTFAALPQLAVSADLAWRHVDTQFAGFEPKTVGVAVSAHWYIR